MKKFFVCLTVFLLTAALLISCGKAPAQETTEPSATPATEPSATPTTEPMTEPATEPTPTETEENMEYEGDASSYYIDVVKLNTVLDRTSYAYRLYRYNSALGTTEIMQLWASASSYEGEKYSSLMWRDNGGNIRDFAVRNY